MTNEELQKEMIAAMKAKDKVRLSIIRQVKAEVKNIEVNERRDVTEEDVNSMIKRLIKQTSETLEMSHQGRHRPRAYRQPDRAGQDPGEPAARAGFGRGARGLD